MVILRTLYSEGLFILYTIWLKGFRNVYIDFYEVVKFYLDISQSHNHNLKVSLLVPLFDNYYFY